MTRTITAYGETRTIKEWAEIAGVSDSAINNRLRAGLSPEECVAPRGGKGGRASGRRPRPKPDTHLDEPPRHDTEWRHKPWRTMEIPEE